MINPYSYFQRAAQWRRFALTALLGGGSVLATQAQTLNYVAGGASNVTGTYTDLGTAGTAITTANTDDANSDAQAIGFDFSYNGTTFRQFVLNTNGVIRLGSAPPSTAALYYENVAGSNATDPLVSTNAADVNLLMPFNFDLVPGTAGGTEYRVSTTGTAGSQVCTIQWKNVSDKAGAGTDVANVTQYANFSFQLKLYEATGTIEFVYGPAVAATGAAGIRFPNVGLKGSGLSAGQVLLGLKLNTALWSTTTFMSTNYTTNAHDIQNTALPDAGRTYRFARLSASDAATTVIYTYGKLATPFALPHTVQAVVTNAGSAALTNVPVVLTVAGANTFSDTKTVATLAAGASTTVTFAPYPATMAVGTNNLTVTTNATGDTNAGNNTATYTQQITTDRNTYLDPTVALAATGVGVGAATGAAVIKYTLPAAANYITEVAPTFAAGTFAATTYQVVVYDATGANGLPGSLLYTSATQTHDATASTSTIKLPSVQVGSTFYIGLKELDNNLGLAYQPETPLRPATYYFQTSPTGAWTATSLQYRRAIEFSLGVAPACPAPSALAVGGITFNSASVSFTGPANGTAYSIIYGPTGFNPATGGTTITSATSPVTLPGLTASTTYQVYVQATCGTTGQSVQAGPVTFSTPCQAPIISTFPYTENFDGVTAPAVPCGITITDVNADGKTWAAIAENPSSAPNAMRYTYSTANAANDWFYTPALTLQTGMRYQVQFKYRARGASFPEGLEVKIGSAATPAGQTTTLFSNTAITNITYATTTASQVASFTPTTAGNYFVGFHAISAADEFYLYVDDISVTAATVTATINNVAPGFKAEASPVPFNDQLTLSLKTLAAGPLQLTLHDALGRVVRETSAMVPAGASTVAVPQVASLPAGIYLLTVRQGGNTQVIRVAHE